MKELSIEEKARAYDEALERAKKVNKCEADDREPGTSICEYIFPELKESEEEKIRKGLINGFNKCLKDSLYPENAQKYWHGIKIEDILAWLEKQGEQKPQRMISAEAKEALYNKPVGKAEPFDKYEGLTDFERTLADICIGWIGEESCWKQYIKDNADVLLRIAAEKFNSVQVAPSEQKPAWSEEDEKIFNAAILHIKNETYNYYGGYSSECIMQWLKSLKTRVGYEDEWKPSEEQMKVLSIYADQNNSHGSVLTSLLDDLKKLRNK